MGKGDLRGPRKHKAEMVVWVRSEAGEGWNVGEDCEWSLSEPGGQQTLELGVSPELLLDLTHLHCRNKNRQRREDQESKSSGLALVIAQLQKWGPHLQS